MNVPSGKGKAAAGGLAMALTAALREYRGLWFGWSGEICETFTGQIAMHKVQGVTTALVDLEEGDFQEYYNGYANKTLWPLFHYRIDLTAYARSFGEGYERVNRRFGETVAPLIEADDLVWVHDYHLIPLGRELRKRGVTSPIGFFLHIPWPARQLITTLPRHRELVESLFAYDLIGFQTEEWLDAFAGYVRKEAGGEALGDGRFRCFGRTVRAAAFPIGLDAPEFSAMAESAEARRTFERMRRSVSGRKLIVGVDRLDYSKGMEERLLGYETFLNHHPEHRGRVTLLQIAPPSREDVHAYQEIRGRMEALSGRINGAYADVDWVPVRYVSRAYKREELAGIFRAAQIGYVTPLRDGMNLVAKEYVAAQDADDPGVLILSRFAGAALQLKDAVIVNPFSQEGLAEALQAAIEMPLEERKRRWESMMQSVMREDVAHWRDDFVAALMRARDEARSKAAE